MSGAYYNEFDPKAAAWLRELMREGLIAEGEVDERSIEEVTYAEIKSFTQHHFFAGIGVWSYALRAAGWTDDRPVWTGSCPCQPFSDAGEGKGFADERHLWPAFYHLIGIGRPRVVLGEQVASKAGLAWIDLVQADMEAAGSAFGALDFCAAGVGAPHMRQRQFWVAISADLLAHNDSKGRSRRGPRGGWRDELAHYRSTGFMADLESDGRKRRADKADSGRRKRTLGLESAPRGLGDGDSAGPQGSQSGRDGGNQRAVGSSSVARGLEHADLAVATEARTKRGGKLGRPADHAGDRNGDAGLSGSTQGFWRDADWLHCRDGRWRPVEAGTFPLVDGAPARVGRLRGYGNALVAPQAIAFVEEVMDVLG